MNERPLFTYNEEGCRTKRESLQDLKQKIEVLDTQNGKVFMVGELPENSFGEILEKLTDYIATCDFSDKNPCDGDCVSIAGQVVLDLKKYFKDNDYYIATIGTEDRGTSIPLYEQFGYGHHSMNFITNGEIYAAFDVTAGYTFPIKGSVMFLTVASSEEGLLDVLRQTTGVGWSVVD